MASDQIPETFIIKNLFSWVKEKKNPGNLCGLHVYCHRNVLENVIQSGW